MKKFEFRLESVLRLRSLKLTAEREKLSAILAEAARLEASLNALDGERAEALDFVQKTPTVGSMELRALSAFLLGCEKRVAQLRTAIQLALERAAEQRQRVTTAGRDERLLVKLKEKRLAEWQHEADHELEILAQESWNAVNWTRDR